MFSRVDRFQISLLVIETKTVMHQAILQLMLLLTRGNLSKLLLRHTTNKSIQSAKYLSNTLSIQKLPLRSSDQFLDTQQTLRYQMLAQSIINLLEHQFQKLVTLAWFDIHDTIHIAHSDQFLTRQSLTHNQCLVGLCDTQSGYESPAGTSLCY